MARSNVASDLPPDAEALEYGEKLILVALRSIAIGRSDCPKLRSAFVQACGPGGDAAFAALFTLVRHIGWRANRRFTLHMPGCPCLSADEEALIATFAAAQEAVLTGREERLAERFAGVLQAPPPPPILEEAKRVARLLAAGGHILPERDVEDVFEAGPVSPPPVYH